MFGKIFRSMYEGSLCGQWEAIVTFQQMIVLSDDEGFIDMRPEAIANITSIPVEIIKKGISILEKPDPDSRNSEEEGRRIIKFRDGFGWKVVNKQYYSKLRNHENRKQYMKEYMRNYRKTKK